jgi:phenylacetate-coenzyme A ligase PaaK-like adenylate-forming protein
MIWNQKFECMSRDEMRELQGEKLKKIVAHAYRNSPSTKRDSMSTEYILTILGPLMT